MSFRFREWQIYKDVRTFRREIIVKVIPLMPSSERFELVSQLKRAINSVILNLAEGSYRRSDKDFAHFLNQAMTSLYEVVACLELAYDDNFIKKELLIYFIKKAEAIAKQLSDFIKCLQK